MNKCIICGSKVFKDKWRHIRKTCSEACHSMHMSKIHTPRPRKGVTKICEFCKNEYYVPEYRKNITKYCSRRCLAKVHLSQFENFRFQPLGHPIHKYKTIKVNGKHVRLHRHLMQKHLGRKLLSSEHVHHINGDSLDNRIENLIVLSNADHQRVEHVYRRQLLSQ